MQRVEAKKAELELLSNCKVKLRKAILLNSDAELIKVLRDKDSKEIFTKRNK
jgi:hypothetical protein